MSNPAIREDVIVALERQAGVTVTRLPGGVIEVVAPGQPYRVFPLKSIVCRGLLYDFERYYGVPMGAFYPATNKAKKDAV